jgi:hypothetical protein
MTLQSTGKISLSDIQTMFGGTNPITMSEYYNNNASGFTTGVSGIPNSGATISISHFYGKAKPSSGGLYAFSTHTFTNAGATGQTGPIISQVRSAYSGATWAQNNSYLSMTTQGIQLWTVPATGSYTITCAGAKGGNNTASGGSGAIMTGTFSFTSGDIVSILVGQVGNNGISASGNCAGGGGGGTFVIYNGSPLIIAGGGGGAPYGANAGGAGSSGVNGVNGPGSGGTGGTSGSGATGGSDGSGGGNNGGGYSGNGSGGGGFTGGGGFNLNGKAYLNGGTGGYATAQGNAWGGFGGGACSYVNGSSYDDGGGGGGGYSGGGGGGPGRAWGGGGGGSYGGTFSSYNTGVGYVTITTGTITQTPSGPTGGTGGSVDISTYNAITATSAVAFSYIAMPGGSRTLLNYLQSFGVLGTSTNTGSGSWLSSYSGNISYTANPISNNTYFTTYGRVRIIDGDGSSDGPDWAVFNFGPASNGDFDGYSSTYAYFGGENSYSGGTGGLVVTTGYVWGFTTNGWTMLYRLSLPGDGTNNHTNGNWFTSGGTVTTGNGKRSEYDSSPITHLGFSVS